MIECLTFNISKGKDVNKTLVENYISPVICLFPASFFGLRQIIIYIIGAATLLKLLLENAVTNAYTVQRPLKFKFLCIVNSSSFPSKAYVLIV